MFLNTLARVRTTGAAVAALTLVTACSYTDTPSAPIKAPGSALTLGIDISSVVAGPGSQVAVALDAEYIGTLGGLQGYLRFDSSRLRYVGQSTTDGDIVLVNAKDAARGALRIGAMNSEGLGDQIGTLVFDVLAPGYATTLGFEAEEAVTTGGPVETIQNVRLAHIGATTDESLRVPADPTQLSVADWQQRREPGADPKWLSFNIPGQNVPGLVYGDVNLSALGGTSAITLSDALAVLNVSVGVNQLITGTDAPAVDAVIAANVIPANVGGTIPPGFVTADDHGELTLGDALAILNESVGILQPVVGDLIRPAAATNRVVVNANVTTNTTWTKNNVYELQGGIQVTGGATLTIEPGTVIEGQRGTGPGVGGAALFVQRDGKIVAAGTVAEPIVFTCVGTPTARFKGCWGGLVINGNATLNEGTPTSPVIAGRAATGGCNEQNGEGTSGLFGGCNPDDNSGTLRYVRVEYAGFRFTATNELNGLALQGVGRGTTIDYVQVHAGLDDGLEYFGGTVNARHLYLTANSDDSMDWVSGWSGSVQFVIVQQDSLDADKGFEADNSNTLFDALPRALPTIYNVTFVGKRDPAGTGGPAANNVEDMMHIRRGTRPVISNVIGEGFPFILRCDDTPTASTPFVIQNGRFNNNGANQNGSSTCPAPYNAASNPLGTLFAANTFDAATTLLDGYNVLLPDFRPAFGTATGGAIPGGGSDPAFTWDATATYKGAVAPANSGKANIPWYSGWTRGWQSATAP